MLLKRLLLGILLLSGCAPEQDDKAFTAVKNLVNTIEHKIVSHLCIENLDTRIENGVKKETTCFLSKDDGKVVKMVEHAFADRPGEIFRSKAILYFDGGHLVAYTTADTTNSVEETNYAVYFRNDTIVKTIVKVDKLDFSASSNWVLIMAESIREDRCSDK